MLTADQETELSARILSFIGMGPNPDQLRELGGSSAVLKAPKGGGGPQIALWLVRFSLSQPDPALFIKIVKAADRGGMHRELHALADALIANPSGWTGPGTDELWVPAAERLPFVDRVDLRKVLRSMADGTGPGAILVDAPDGQGKRTVCDYIRQLSGRTGSFVPVVHREIRAQQDSGLLDRILFELQAALQLAALPDSTHAEGVRVGTVTARNLANGVRMSPPPTPAWLVVNLVDLKPDGELVAFLDELLASVRDDPDVSRGVRFVLLTNQVSQFSLANLPAPDDRHVLPDVTCAEIGEWLALAVPRRQPRIYELFAAEVLSQLEAKTASDPAQRLWWLARFCGTAHDTLAARP